MNAAERAARERVEAVYAAVDGLTPEQLAWSSVPDRDLEERTIALAELERDADRHGRGPLLDEARGWLRDALVARRASRPSAYAESGAFGISVMGRPEEIASVELALEDAVSVAVAEDLLDPEVAAALADPGRRLLGLAPLAASSVAPDPAAGAWEPSPADWDAAATTGVAAVDHDQPMAGNHRVQVAFFAVMGALTAGAVLLMGIASGELVGGLAGAVVVVLLAYTFATYRRPITRG